MRSAFEAALERWSKPGAFNALSYHRQSVGFKARDAYQSSGEYSGSSVGFGRSSSKRSSGDCRSIGFLKEAA